MANIKIFEQIYREASKERFIKNNPRLTDVEKDEMIEFYEEHPNLDSVGINWQGNWTFEDFEKVRDKYIRPINTKDIILNEDYLYFGEKDGLKYYVPITYMGLTTLIDDPNIQSRWCITSPSGWEEYTYDRQSFFVLVFDKSHDIIAIEFAEEDLNIWNRQNRTYGFGYADLDEYIDVPFDFTNPTNSTSSYANDNIELAISDNKKFASHLDKAILSNINNETNKILRLIKKYNRY